MQVDHVMMQGGGDLSNILYVPGGGTPGLVGCGFPRFENLRFDDDPAGQYGGQVTPNSILEDPMQHGGGSGGSAARHARRGDDVVPTRKKKSGGGGGGFFPQIVLSLGNRRKGAPHRAPLA